MRSGWPRSTELGSSEGIAGEHVGPRSERAVGGPSAHEGYPLPCDARGVSRAGASSACVEDEPLEPSAGRAREERPAVKRQLCRRHVWVLFTAKRSPDGRGARPSHCGARGECASAPKRPFVRGADHRAGRCARCSLRGGGRSRVARAPSFAAAGSRRLVDGVLCVRLRSAAVRVSVGDWP